MGKKKPKTKNMGGTNVVTVREKYWVCLPVTNIVHTLKRKQKEKYWGSFLKLKIWKIILCITQKLGSHRIKHW